MDYNKLTLKLEDQIPDYAQELYPMFVIFLTKYYEWMETQGNPQDIIQNIQLNRDIDTTASSLASRFYAMYMPNMPQNPMADQRLMLKNFRDFYERKGSEASFKFFFHAFFDDAITVDRPVEQLFTTSDGDWYVENYVLAAPDSGTPDSLLHTYITGETSGARAAVNSIAHVRENDGNYYRLILNQNSWTGAFTTGETITGQYWDFANDTSTAITMTVVKPQQADAGVWRNTRSQLSADQVLQDSLYYQKFSYVIRSRVGLDQWYTALMQEIHPLGTKVFNTLLLDTNEVSSVNTITTFGQTSRIETSVIIPTQKDFYIAPSFSWDRIATYRTGTSATTTAGTLIYDANYVYPGQNITFALQKSGDDGSRPAVAVGGATFDKIGAGVAQQNQLIAWDSTIKYDDPNYVDTYYHQNQAISLSANTIIASDAGDAIEANVTSILLVITWVKDNLPVNAVQGETSNTLYISVSSVGSIKTYYGAATQRNYRSIAVGQTLPYPQLTYYHDDVTSIVNLAGINSGSSSTTVNTWKFTPQNYGKSQSYDRMVLRIVADTSATVNFSVSVSSNCTFNAKATDFLDITTIGV